MNDSRLKIKEDMQKVLKNNKIIVDKYLDLCYNNAISKLVREDDDKERGKILLIEELRSLIK